MADSIQDNRILKMAEVRMNRKWNQRAVVFLLLSAVLGVPAYGAPAELILKEAAQIAKLIFRNECDLREKCLISWNAGEDFLSLGLGHFIWYPAGKKGPYEESFPKFLDYMAKSRPDIIPDWLRPTGTQCPWKNRKHFLQDLSGPQMLQLELFLRATTTQQVLFMTGRFYRVMNHLLGRKDTTAYGRLTEKLDAILACPNGFYVLIDYINFKGEGLSPSEHYRNQGWGLVQVLEEMNYSAAEGDDAISAFVRAAKTVLQRRVRNVRWWQRSEKKWLPGWEKRLDSYLEAQLSSVADIPSPLCDSIESSTARISVDGLLDTAKTSVK